MVQALRLRWGCFKFRVPMVIFYSSVCARDASLIVGAFNIPRSLGW